MTLHEFVEKYKGAKVDFDGAYGAQCVDLVRQYFKDVWEVPQPEGVEGAVDFYSRHRTRPRQEKYMDCIQYCVKGQVIPEGAVVIFKTTATNKYGHIGICLGGDAETMRLFEQDGFKQDGAKITRRDYSRVLGWLLRKSEG